MTTDNNPENTTNVRNLQVATINTFMGSLLSLFNAIIVTNYFTDWAWVLILLGIVSAMAWSMIVRMGKGFNAYNFILNAVLAGLFAFALYQRSLSTQKPVSAEIFWPIAPVFIYVIWVILLELILRGKGI